MLAVSGDYGAVPRLRAGLPFCLSCVWDVWEPLRQSVPVAIAASIWDVPLWLGMPAAVAAS